MSDVSVNIKITEQMKALEPRELLQDVLVPAINVLLNNCDVAGLVPTMIEHQVVEEHLVLLVRGEMPHARWVCVYQQYGNWKTTVPFNTKAEAERHADLYLRSSEVDPRRGEDKKHLAIRQLLTPPSGR